MYTTFIRLIGIYSIGCGCYLLLSLFVPKLQDRKWREQPASLFLLGASGCVLLGMWAFGIARPYTWIAGVVVWGVGYFVQRPVARNSVATPVRIMERREAIAAIILLLGIIAVMLRVFWG